MEASLSTEMAWAMSAYFAKLQAILTSVARAMSAYFAKPQAILTSESKSESKSGSEDEEEDKEENEEENRKGERGGTSTRIGISRLGLVPRRMFESTLVGLCLDGPGRALELAGPELDRREDRRKDRRIVRILRGLTVECEALSEWDGERKKERERWRRLGECGLGFFEDGDGEEDGEDGEGRGRGRTDGEFLLSPPSWSEAWKRTGVAALRKEDLDRCERAWHVRNQLVVLGETLEAVRAEETDRIGHGIDPRRRLELLVGSLPPLRGLRPRSGADGPSAADGY